MDTNVSSTPTPPTTHYSSEEEETHLPSPGERGLGTEDTPSYVDRSSLVPVPGQGTPVFFSIHGTALASLGISIVASFCVLIYMKRERSPKPGHPGTTLWKLPIGERLVVYLSIGDLLFSVTHAIDHGLMLALVGNPPDKACVVMAFFMLSFYYTPSIIAVFTAMNAFVMVVLQRHLKLGQYDWRLLVPAFGIPALIMMVSASLGYLGASGIACSFYYGNAGGRLLGQIFSVSMVTLFALNASFYALVCIKIRRMGQQTGSTKFVKSARIMLIFVVAYFSQNWSVTIYYTWGFFSYPPLAMVYLVVTFVNMGGVFNAIAYTVLRRKYVTVSSASTGTDTAETGT